jgi:hypothetical protein
MKVLKMQFNFLGSIKEGLVSSSSSSSTTASTSSVLDGYAGNAQSYAAAIKALSVQLSDKLIVSKYRTDYENIIINLEDYISLLMMNIILTINTNSSSSSSTTQDDTVKLLNDLGSLKASKDALNDTMKYLDSMT